MPSGPTLSDVDTRNMKAANLPGRLPVPRANTPTGTALMTLPTRAVSAMTPTPTVAEEFIKGGLTTGLLAALQNRGSSAATFDQRALRLAIQGGTALAASTAAVQAIRQGQHGRAALAVAVGAVAIVATERFLNTEQSSI